jgi:hypothetical protein
MVCIPKHDCGQLCDAAEPGIEGVLGRAAGVYQARFVTPIDICLGPGWPRDGRVDPWGGTDLEDFLPVRDDRPIDLYVCLRHRATARPAGSARSHLRAVIRHIDD